jgi:hypothetical protein
MTCMSSQNVVVFLKNLHLVSKLTNASTTFTKFKLESHAVLAVINGLVEAVQGLEARWLVIFCVD